MPMKKYKIEMIDGGLKIKIIKNDKYIILDLIDVWTTLNVYSNDNDLDIFVEHKEWKNCVV